MSRSVCRHDAGTGGWSRVLLALGILLLPLLAFPASGAAQRLDRPPLDLAAMVLTPADIEAANLDWRGSTDYAHRSSELLFAEAYMELVAESVDAPDDTITAALEEAGLIRAYQSHLTPGTVADGDAERSIVSWIVEYADRDGAAAAWAFLRDQPALPGVTEVDDLESFGDASYAVLEEGDDPDTGVPYAILETSVLIGRLHIGVWLLDWGGAEPGIEDAEALTQTLVENVEEGRVSLAAGLSNQVLRLTGDTVEPRTDTYTLRDGRAIPLYNDTVDVAEIEEDAAAMGLTDDYRVWQYLFRGTGDQEDDSVYYLTVMRFVDDEAAADWLAARPDAINSYESFTDVEFVPEDDLDYGDAAFSYTATSVNTDTHFHNITVQVDDQIVILDLSGPATAPVDAIAPLAEAQITCLEEGECMEPMELPQALEDFLEEISS